MWEISLPPPVITIDYNSSVLQNEMINDIKTLALKGHDVYSIVFEKLHCFPCDLEGVPNLKQILSKEQAYFKQKIEEVQLQLTSPSLENKDFEEDHKGFFALNDFVLELIFAVFSTPSIVENTGWFGAN